MVLETTGSGLVKSRFLRGAGLIAQQIDDQLHFYLHNAHGDVVQQVDGSGTVLCDYECNAFGVEREPNPLDPNPFRYCGEYTDGESGQVYLRNRYYDPGTGRFTSEDPIRSGANWYAYCGGNPIRYVDPMGLAWYERTQSEHSGSSTFRGSADWDWYNNAAYSVGYVNKRIYGDVSGASSGNRADPDQVRYFSGQASGKLSSDAWGAVYHAREDSRSGASFDFAPNTVEIESDSSG